jgi:hypothetical protein
MEFANVLKEILNNQSTLIQIIAILTPGFFVIKQVLIILNRSKFDLLFLTKDQIQWNKAIKFLIFLLIFNLFGALWGIFATQAKTIPKIKTLLETLGISLILLFILSLLLIYLILYIRLLFHNLKLFKIRDKKTNNIIKWLVYCNMMLAYLSFLTLNVFLYKNVEPLKIYPLLNLIWIPLLLSASYFFILRVWFDSFYLSSKSTNSFIISLPGFNDKKLFVLHSIEKNLIVLGDEPTEILSNKLYIYDRDKKDLLEFTKGIQKEDLGTDDIEVSPETLSRVKKHRR